MQIIDLDYAIETLGHAILPCLLTHTVLYFSILGYFKEHCVMILASAI